MVRGDFGKPYQLATDGELWWVQSRTDGWDHPVRFISQTAAQELCDQLNEDAPPGQAEIDRAYQ